MAKRAVYPGMFDPVHNGHVDVIQRSLRIFDELIVAVVANPAKEPLFTVDQRLEKVQSRLASCTRPWRSFRNYAGMKGLRPEQPLRPE